MKQNNKNKIIQIRNLTKSFDKNVILNNINLDLFEKESLAIIGKSGSGKSVLLKCIIGLLTPNKGSIKIDGREMVNSSSREKEKILLDFGVTFQNGALFDSLTVWENIVFRTIKFNKLSKNDAKKLALSIILNLGLDKNILNLYPSELSGGMQKRVAIARAICDKPKILLFDEPTSGLDPITGSIIDELIKNTVSRLGVTAITITHDMSSVFKFADRVILINNNNIEWVGLPKKMNDSKNETIKKFLKNKNYD